MHRVLVTILFASALGACVAAGGDESFVMDGVLAPPEDSCSFTPSTTGPFLSRGAVDFSNPSYFVGMQFESRVVAGDGKESLRTIFINGANIHLDIGQLVVTENGVSTPTGPAASTFEFQELFSAALGPNGGLTAAGFDLIPVQVMQGIQAAASSVGNSPALAQAEVLATVTAFGDFYGDRIDSTSFKFPITVGNTLRRRDTCPVDATAVVASVNGCSELQDSPIACCVDTTNSFRCLQDLIICGDGRCEAPDEDLQTCPEDCTPPP